MKLSRRKFLRLAAGAVAFPSLPRFASVLDYPTRPVHLIAGFPPGGIVDMMARMVSQALSERLGQRFVVENRTGAGGTIAAEYVARAKPDGYTLLLTNAADAWNTAIYDNLNFDYLRDITPVTGIERAGGVMEVNLSVPVNSVTEFIAYAKANPGKINMASAGPGSGPHIYGELFKSMAGVNLVTVHYRGGGPALPDLIGGRVQVMFDPIASSIGYLRAGKLRPLGVTSATRVAVLPDVPTIGEFVCWLARWHGGQRRRLRTDWRHHRRDYRRPHRWLVATSARHCNRWRHDRCDHQRLHRRSHLAAYSATG